jgi:hypothetical protein
MVINHLHSSSDVCSCHIWHNYLSLGILWLDNYLALVICMLPLARNYISFKVLCTVCTYYCTMLRTLYPLGDMCLYYG